MRVFTESDGWVAMLDDVFYTASMLEASGVHGALARPLNLQIESWDSLDAERVKLERAAVRAEARIAWLNLDLDGRTKFFGAQLLLECGSNRGHETFMRFFPVNVTNVVRLALESQVAAMRPWPKLGEALGLPKASASALAAAVLLFDPADKAVAARNDTATAQTLASVKQSAWRDEANRARRAVEAALLDHANKHSLAHDYPDAFFPKRKGAAKPATPDPAPQPA